MNGRVIAIDFDGTLVVHEYPKIGNEVPNAFKWLKRFQELGALLILYTMRSSNPLQDAIEFCRDRGIEFWGINTNPTQREWTNSPKCYAQMYIDDAFACCPLVSNPEGRDYVDWDVVGPIVEKWLTGRQ